LTLPKRVVMVVLHATVSPFSRYSSFSAGYS